MKRSLKGLRWGVLGLGLLAAPGCLAVAAGAGAAGAVAWTQRGASSLAEGGVNEVFERSIAVFEQMGITRTGDATRASGAERSLTGRKDDMDVTVEMTRETATTTRVEVLARRNEVQYERGYARDVLARIVAR